MTRRDNCQLTDVLPKRGNRRSLIRCLVVMLAACAPAVQAPSERSTNQARPAFLADSAPPLVAGIRLGDSTARVRVVLGSPTTDSRSVADARELVYWPRGIVVLTNTTQGVAMIGLVNPAAPVLAGVRIGDPVSYMVQQWGDPYRRDATRLTYKSGSWGVLVVMDTSIVPNRVESITFGWSQPRQPGGITPPWHSAPQ